MAKTESIEQRVIKAIKTRLGEPQEGVELTSDSNLVEVYTIDSLDKVEFVMGLEEEFSLSIPDVDVEKMFTVGKGEYAASNETQKALVKDIVTYISQRVSKNNLQANPPREYD